jgi:hypothetical protein
MLKESDALVEFIQRETAAEAVSASGGAVGAALGAVLRRVQRMLHEHAAGKPVAAHVRCRIMTGESLTGPFHDVFVDVEMGMFEMMPETEMPAASPEIGPARSAN